jgi:glycosyltransferase involved in cell wall biosynthesis
MRLDNYKERSDQGSVSVGDDTRLNAKDILKIWLKALVENSPLIIPKDFLKIIDGFKPEVIYTMGADFFTHRIVLYFAKRYGIPVVMHFMDNWRETAFTQDARLLGINRKLECQVEEIEKHMNYGLTISQCMADAYKKEYGHEYFALMHTIKPMDVEEIAHDGLNLVYAGGLHLNRNLMLHELSETIKSMPDVKLFIYTSKDNRTKYESEFSGVNTFFMDALPHSQIEEVYKTADVLVHVESFDKNVVDFTKYSMSTKIPEYMACKKPILCYAPEKLASSQCIVESGAGISVHAAEELCDAIESLRDKTTRISMGFAGLRYANENFSEDALAKVVSYVFSNSVKHGDKE